MVVGRYVALQQLRQGVSYFIHRQMSSGFLAWRMRHAMACCNRPWVRWASWRVHPTRANRELSRAWAVWLLMCTANMKAVVLERMSSEFREQRRLRRAFLWMATRADLMRLTAATVGRLEMAQVIKMRASFQGWCRHLSEHKRAEDNMRRALGRFMHQALFAGLQAFVRHTAWMSKMRYCLARLANKRLSGGWRTWMSATSGGSVGARLMRKAVHFMQHRELSRGHRAWRTAHEERVRALRLMRKGVSYMCNRKMAGAMRRWSSSIGGQSGRPPSWSVPSRTFATGSSRCRVAVVRHGRRARRGDATPPPRRGLLRRARGTARIRALAGPPAIGWPRARAQERRLPAACGVPQVAPRSAR